MRVVAREQHTVLTDLAHERRKVRLVGLARDPALASEVLARRPRDIGLALDAASLFPVLIHPPEPVRQPAAARLEEGHAKARMALEHPALDERQHRQHLL